MRPDTGALWTCAVPGDVERPLLLELTRAAAAADPYAFRVGEQTYILRLPTGAVREVKLTWDDALLQAIMAASRAEGGAGARASLGDRLRALLGEGVLTELAAARAITPLTLRFNAMELFALPWEMLTLPTGQTLAEVQTVRPAYAWSDAAAAPASPDLPLGGGRIVFAHASTGGPVPHAAHERALRAAMAVTAAENRVSLAPLAGASLVGIRAALDADDEAPARVLHLLCHGTLGPDGLSLALEEGPVSGEQLRASLGPLAAKTRLVVLSACRTGGVDSPASRLASLGEALHRVGFAAVLASRTPLSVAGSIVLTEALYDALLHEERSVDDAVAWARAALVAQGHLLDAQGLMLFVRPEDRGLLPFGRRRGLARLRPLIMALEERFGDGAEAVQAARELLLQRDARLALSTTARDWCALVLEADRTTRAALLRLVWPVAAAADREDLRRRIVCILGASTLNAAELWSLMEKVGVATQLPTDATLDRFLEELSLAARTHERLGSLLVQLGAALVPEEARLFGIADLSLAWDAWERAEARAREEALRADLLAQIAALRAARGRPAAEINRALDVVLDTPPLEGQAPDPDRALDGERDLDQAEDLLSPWRLRWGFWGWPRAAALLARARRAGLDPEQRQRALALSERLRPRLRWLLSGALGWAALTLLSAAVPLYVWGAVAAPPLAWLLRLLRPVALAAGVFVAGVGGQIALVGEGSGEEGEETKYPWAEDTKDRIVKEWEEEQKRRAAERKRKGLADRPSGWDEPFPPEPERWVAAARFAWDEQGRVVEQEPPPPPPPPPVKPKRKPEKTTASAPDQEGATQSDNGEAVKGLESGGVFAQVIASNAEGEGGPTGEVFKTTSIPDAPMEFVGLSGGRFLMGSPEGVGSDDERPQHPVTVSAFAIGRSEVTQAQWAAVVKAAQRAGDADATKLKVDPSHFKGLTLPVEQVSWCDAARFANALSRMEGRKPAYTGVSDCAWGGAVGWDREANGYRLPTEAEWEYAARAGTTTAYATGDTGADLARAGWYDGNSGDQTHEVCTREAKPWGLCDLHGNVMEWTWDRYAAYSAEEANNPSGDGDHVQRVIRGGSYNASFLALTVRNRGGDGPGARGSFLGFRLVLPVTVPESG